MTLRPEDTSAEAFEVLMRVARRSTAEQKLAQALALTEFSRGLSRAGLRMRYPDASVPELHRRFAALLHGEQMATRVLGWSLREEVNQVETLPGAVLSTVLEALRHAGVAHVVGGSLASSLHGLPRATNDVDIVADVQPRHLSTLHGALAEQFYFDADAAADALRHGTSLNLIHYETLLKIDVFVVGQDPFRRAQIAHATWREVGALGLPVLSQEDTILAKLHRYNQGGGVSERQWRDVLEVMTAQAGMLDQDYLRRTAAAMGLEELLDRALAQSAGEQPPTD